MQRTLYTTNLASMFRSVRFSISEARGRGVLMQFNYLTNERAIKFNNKTGTFSSYPSSQKDLPWDNSSSGSIDALGRG